MTTSPYRLPCEPESHELLDMRSSGAARRALDYYLKEEMCASAPNDAFFSIKPVSARRKPWCMLGPVAQRGCHSLRIGEQPSRQPA